MATAAFAQTRIAGAAPKVAASRSRQSVRVQVRPWHRSQGAWRTVATGRLPPPYALPDRRCCRLPEPLVAAGLQQSLLCRAAAAHLI